MADRRDLAPEFRTGDAVDVFHSRPHLGQLAFELDVPTDVTDGYRDIIVRQTGPNMSDGATRAAHAAKVAGGGYSVLNLFEVSRPQPGSEVVDPMTGDNL